MTASSDGNTRVRARGFSRRYLGALLVVLFAVVLRGGILSTGQKYLHSDEAVVGLMAKHIVTRGERPIFEYGQSYGGGHAVVAYLTAPLFALFGRSAVLLTAVSALFSVGSVLLLWLILHRHLGAAVGLGGAALYACSPPVVSQATMVNGGNVSSCLALLSLLFFLKAFYRRRARLRDSGLSGFFAGVAYYSLDYALLYPIVFTTLWLVAGGAHRWRSLAVFFGSFLVGCSPLIVFNLLNDNAHLRQIYAGGGTEPKQILDFIRALWFALTDGLAGLMHGEVLTVNREAISVGARFHSIVAIGAMVLGFAGVVGRMMGRRNGRELLAFAVVPVLFFAVYLVIYSVAKWSANPTPRYLLPLSPFLSMAIAHVALGNHRRWARRLGVILVFALIARSTITSATIGTRDWHEEHGARCSGPALEHLTEYLEDRSIRTVMAPYEIQWRLLFSSDERVIASSSGLSTNPRYDFYTEEVQRRISDGEAFALILNPDFAFAGRLASAELRGAGLRHVHEVLGDRVEPLSDEFLVFYPLVASDWERLISR